MKVFALCAVVALAAAACSKDKGSECQRFVDKSKPAFKDLEKEMGKPINDEVLAGMLDECKKAEKRDPIMDCVLEAPTTDGVRDCWIKAFKSYGERSKSIEAKMGLRKIYSGARNHYLYPPVPDPTAMEPEDPGLPNSAGPTPPLGQCCVDGGRCAPNPDYWIGETWTALHFSMDDPHYYSYEFKSNGKDTFTVLAYGDLDCDGEYSTFSMVGNVGDGSLDEFPHEVPITTDKEDE